MSLDPNIQHVFTNKKFRDSSELRILELENIKSQNGNPFNITALSSPVTPAASYTNTVPYLWICNRKLIHLMDTWNRIMTCMFTSEVTWFSTNKVPGANIYNNNEYLFKTTFPSTPNFSVSFIGVQLVNFFKGVAADMNGKDTGTRTNISYPTNIKSKINLSYSLYDPYTLATLNELLEIFKSLISETKLKALVPAITSKSFLNLEPSGRGNFALLPNTTTLFANIVEDSGFIDLDGKAIPIQFAEKIDRNIESEAWLYRNVAIKYTDINDPNLKVKRKYATQLSMAKPLVFNSFYVDWTNPENRPFIMIYNGISSFGIPDEAKKTINKNDQQSFHWPITANFYEIGTSNTEDPNYNPLSDIKLNTGGFGGRSLYETTKFDFFDNLTIYHKID